LIDFTREIGAQPFAAPAPIAAGIPAHASSPTKILRIISALPM
jgi:hypothetical protein